MSLEETFIDDGSLMKEIDSVIDDKPLNENNVDNSSKHKSEMESNKNQSIELNDEAGGEIDEDSVQIVKKLQEKSLIETTGDINDVLLRKEENHSVNTFTDDRKNESLVNNNDSLSSRNDETITCDDEKELIKDVKDKIQVNINISTNHGIEDIRCSDNESEQLNENLLAIENDSLMNDNCVKQINKNILEIDSKLLMNTIQRKFIECNEMDESVNTSSNVIKSEPLMKNIVHLKKTCDKNILLSENEIKTESCNNDDEPTSESLVDSIKMEVGAIGIDKSNVEMILPDNCNLNGIVKSELNSDDESFEMNIKTELIDEEINDERCSDVIDEMILTERLKLYRKAKLLKSLMNRKDDLMKIKKEIVNDEIKHGSLMNRKDDLMKIKKEIVNDEIKHGSLVKGAAGFLIDSLVNVSDDVYSQIVNVRPEMGIHEEIDIKPEQSILQGMLSNPWPVQKEELIIPDTTNESEMNSSMNNDNEVDAYYKSERMNDDDDSLLTSKVCKYCHKSFKRMKYLKLHYMRNICSSLYMCNYCTFESRRRERIIDHEMSCPFKKPAKKVNPTETFKCSCGSVYNREGRLKACLRIHSLSKPVKLVCHQCGGEFKKYTDYRKHKNTAHMDYHCKFCPLKFHRTGPMYKHLLLHQHLEKAEFDLMQHTVSEECVLRCYTCDEQFIQPLELRAHILSHEFPQKCFKCDSRHLDLKHLVDHFKLCRVDENEPLMNMLVALATLSRDWVCRPCKRYLGNPEKLGEHLREHETSQPLETGVITTQKATNNSLPDLLCPKCGQNFKEETELSGHMNLHSDDRLFPCQFCDFRFQSNDSLKKHVVIHTGILKYICFVCEFGSKTAATMNRHRKSDQHKNSLERIRLRAESVRKIRSDVCSVLIECEVCKEKFSSHSEMSEHKNRKHTFIEFPNEEKPTRIFFK